MTATAFDPAGIALSAAARDHIAAQIARSDRRFLRLGVKESGCNGFMYTLDYIESPDDGDRCFHFDTVDVYVRHEDLPLVLGTEVDLVVEGLNSSLRFKNARAQSYCGCGESFSVRPD